MRNRYRINNRERKMLFRRKSDILLENTVGTRMFIITSRNGTNHNYFLKVKFVVFSTFYDVRNSRSMRDRASGCITLSKIRKLKTFIFPRRAQKTFAANEQSNGELFSKLQITVSGIFNTLFKEVVAESNAC